MSVFVEALADWQRANIPELIEVIEDRLYPVEADQEEGFPFGVFTQISHDCDINHSGVSGWGSMRVQYDFYGREIGHVLDATKALRGAFEGKSFELKPGVRICFCKAETEYDDYDSEGRIYRRTLDLLFEYQIT